MKWLQMWRFLCGYGMINVEGCIVESLLESLRGQQVLVWDVRRRANGARFCTTRAGMLYLNGWQAEHPRAKVQVQPRGMFLRRKRTRAHLPLVCAAGVLMLALLVARGFYWSADVSGVPEHLQGQTQDFLLEQGVHFPIAKRAIDRETLRDQLLLQMPMLCFAEVYGHGVNLRVDAVLRDLPPAVFDVDSGSSDIVSPCDGQIVSIAVTSGTALVQAGDNVRAGDVLIQGIAGREGFERGVQAQGEVCARVFYRQTCAFAETELSQQTGRTQTIRSLHIGPLCFLLDAQDCVFDLYEETQHCTNLLSNHMQMPVFLETITRYELSPADAKTRLFRAQQLTLAKTMQQMHEDAQLIDTDYIEEIRGGEIIVTCTLTANLKIATTQEVYGK